MRHREKLEKGKMVFSSSFPYSHIGLLFSLTGSKVRSVGNRIRGKVDLKAARKVEVGGGIPIHETFEMRFYCIELYRFSNTYIFRKYFKSKNLASLANGYLLG